MSTRVFLLLLATACLSFAETAPAPADTAPAADTEQIAELDTITVTAERIRNAVEEPLLASPALEPMVSVIDADDITAQNASSVVDALDYVPGAWTESRGRKVKSFVSIRGQKYPYPEYAVDGVWQREFLELPYFFSALQVERIEVLRSSAALINGVSGLTGIINIIPKSYDSLGIDVDASYGTFNTYRANILHGNTLGPVQYAVGVGGTQTDGPEGKNAGENSMNFYGRAKYEPNSNLTVQANVFGLYGERELALIEAPGDTTKANLTQPTRFDPHRALIANIKGMYRFNDKASLSLQMYYTRRNHEYYASDTAGHTPSLDLDWEWGGNLIGAMSFLDNNVMRISFLYNNWVAPFGKRFYSGKRTAIQTLSAAVADEHTFGQLTIDLGVRWLKDYIDEYAAYNIDGSNVWRRITLDPVADEWRKSQWNGTLGLRYLLSAGIGLFGHGAFGFVNPSAGALTEDLEEPEAEKQLKGDISGQWAIERIGTLSATGFYNHRFDGLAITRDTSSVDDDGDTLILPLYDNVDMSTAGIEIVAKSERIGGVAEAFANASFMQHRRLGADDTWEQDPQKPQQIVGGGLNLYLGSFDVSVYGKYVSDYESSRFAGNFDGVPGADTVTVGDYSTLDMSGGYTYTAPGGQVIRIYFAVDNVTDERYSTVVGYPDFGREFSIGLKYTY